MQSPWFYSEALTESSSLLLLDEDNSRHCVQVLRMREGAGICLTNGRGQHCDAEIIKADKKACAVQVQAIRFVPPKQPLCTIGISVLKNSSRFEWFLEKAAEIGIGRILPLLCERTERQFFRYERMKGILISAILQSQQCWLPVLEEPRNFNSIISSEKIPQKFIAHCADDTAKQLLSTHYKKVQDAIILIGPEGDFSEAEIALAIENDYQPVSLGHTRLRTETAGVVAASWLA